MLEVEDGLHLRSGLLAVRRHCQTVMSDTYKDREGRHSRTLLWVAEHANLVQALELVEEMLREY